MPLGFSNCIKIIFTLNILLNIFRYCHHHLCIKIKMNIRHISTILIVCFLFNTCSGQYFTSPFYIDQLLNAERTIIDKLIAYIGRQRSNGMEFEESITSFIERAEENNLESSKVSRGLDTPLTSYHIIKRVVKGWGEVKKNMSCTDDVTCPLVTGEDVINKVWKKQDMVPDEKDLLTAALMIVNTQTVYGVSIDELVRGELFGFIDKPLSGDDIFYIADTAKEAGKLYESITWFEYLIENQDKFTEHEFKTSALISRLASAYHEYGVTVKAVDLLKKYKKKFPSDGKVSRDIKYYEARVARSKLSEVLKFQTGDSSRKTKQKKKYEQLCRMAIQKGYKATNLTCSYVPLKNFYGLSKVEVLSQSPRIERIYEAVSEKNIDAMKKYANSTFGKLSSLIATNEYAVTSPQATRSGVLCERNKFFYPRLDNITRSLEQLTGLMLFEDQRVASSLCYEATLEGAGGYQRPIIDYRLEKDMKNRATPFYNAGNKLATIILQLSDVEKGGDIIFPRADFHVPIIKGSAVIVWNLKNDGLPDPRSLRINCPVIRGTKWTAHKHIFYYNQVFHRPCESKI